MYLLVTYLRNGVLALFFICIIDVSIYTQILTKKISCSDTSDANSKQNIAGSLDVIKLVFVFFLKVNCGHCLKWIKGDFCLCHQFWSLFMVYSVGFSLNALFANSTSSKLHIHYVSNIIHVADVIVKPIEVLMSLSLFFDKPAQIDNNIECLTISISSLIYRIKVLFPIASVNGSG